MMLFPLCLTWNVQGLHRAGKRLQVRKVIEESEVDIVCLQETKLNAWNREDNKSTLLFRFLVAPHLDVLGSAGGILTIVNSTSFEIIYSQNLSYGIFTRVKCLGSDSFINVVNVYGPYNSDSASFVVFWEEVAQLFDVGVP